LRNVTDSTDTLIGSDGRSDTGDGTNSLSVINGYFNLASSKTFELQHRCSATSNTVGYGQACTFGDAEVYLEIQITKIITGTTSANPDLFSAKSIATDITGNVANITVIAWSGLQVGKVYEVSANFAHLATSNSVANFTYVNGATIIMKAYSAPPNGDTPYVSRNALFVAMSTTLTARVTLTGTGTIYGVNTNADTFAINGFYLQELNNVTLGSF